jgi:Glycine zipper
MHFRGLKMNSKHADPTSASRISRAAIITFASAFALITMTGCFGSPRANDTVAGAAIGAGGGALIGGAEGSPGTGALIGGLGGGAIGYIVGTEMQNNGYYGNGPYRGYYPGGY